MKHLYSHFKIIFLSLLFVSSNVLFSQSYATLGTGTVVGSNTAAGPINQNSKSLHCQMVYTADEIKASGICSGTISKMGFNVSSAPTDPLPNYTIKLKHTNASNVAVYDGTGLTMVYNTVSYMPTAGGFDLLTLNMPFTWDGRSNILVDICFDQVTTSSSTGQVLLYSPSVTNGFIFSRSNSANQCGVACTTTSSNKPQIQFEFSSGPQLDFGVSSIVKPVTNNNCFSTDSVIVKLTNYGWAATTDFSVNPVTIYFDVTGAATNNFSLTLNSGTIATCESKTVVLNTAYGIYTAGAYSFKAYSTVLGDGAAINDTSYATINKIVTPIPNLGRDTTFCVFPGQYVLNASTTADNLFWSNGANNTSSITVTTTGKYWLRATNLNGCSVTDTVHVTVSSIPVVTLGPDTAYCQGSSIILYAGNAGSNYLWSNGATTPSISINTVGTYSVVVTKDLVCSSSDVVNVTSKVKPNVVLDFTGQTNFCPTQSGRVLTEGTPAGGTYIGAGITGNTFNPSLIGQGTYVIIYSYTGTNGCVANAQDVLTVNACVGVEEVNATQVGLNIYPNPNNGIFTLEIISDSDIDGKISITSIDGKQVFTDVVTGDVLLNKTINVSDLSNGIYYLKLETKDVIKTYKILKQ